MWYGGLKDEMKKFTANEQIVKLTDKSVNLMKKSDSYKEILSPITFVNVYF
jgi:hypothetical protein